jgi:hypothetical protein
MNKRVFVFTESKRSIDNSYQRPRIYAIRESEIKEVRSHWGSQNCYLVVNDIEVEGSFDELVSKLGERVDIK